MEGVEDDVYILRAMLALSDVEDIVGMYLQGVRNASSVSPKTPRDLWQPIECTRYPA